MATNSNNKVVQINLQTLGALLGRTELAARLGKQYDDDRDVYEALGYKTELKFKDYATQYERQDMAKAIVDRPVSATWQGGVDILEMGEEEETALEEAWKELSARLQLTSKFIRLDKLASLGTYGVLLLGFDDVQDRSGMMKEVSKGKRQLLYVKPLSENSVKINTWESNTGNERYGMPLTYQITLKLPSGGNDIITAHYSRVIHVPGELLESEVEGVPVLASVFNRLQDLEKLVGASAEMFWRGARPGYQAVLKDNYQLTTTAEDDLQDQIDEYEHKLRRMLTVAGVEFKALETQVSDPQQHVDIQIQMISAVTGIPKRILVGSERGELSSAEDKSMWLDMIQARRDNYAELQIVRPLVDRCIEYGVLPEPKEEYVVEWTDLYAMSEKEKVEIGKSRSSALKEYASVPEASNILPPSAFLQYGLGLESDDVELIEELREAYVKEEEAAAATAEEEEQLKREESAKSESKESVGSESTQEMEEDQDESRLQTDFNPYHDRVGKFAETTGGAGVGAGATDSEIRSLRAKGSYNPATAEKQRLAESNEKLVASSIGGKALMDNEPFDVLGTRVAIEVKTIVAGKNPKITMHKDSLERKKAYVRKNKVKSYTVAIDARGPEHVVYVQKGLGSFRLKNMQKIGSYEKLAEVIK